MLREQTMTLSRCIPELYISSEQDFLMRTPFSDDWMAKFVARRRAIASKQVAFDFYISVFILYISTFILYCTCIYDATRATFI